MSEFLSFIPCDTISDLALIVLGTLLLNIKRIKVLDIKVSKDGLKVKSLFYKK